MGFRITDSQPQDVEEKKIDIPVVDNAESRWMSNVVGSIFSIFFINQFKIYESLKRENTKSFLWYLGSN